MARKNLERVPGWPIWMGSLKHVTLVGLATLLASGAIFQASKPLDPLFWRGVDVIALVLSGAGVLVVVLDAYRSVATWQLEQVEDWAPRYWDDLTEAVASLARYTDTERAGGASVGNQIIYTEMHAIWDRDRPRVHKWATDLAKTLEPIRPEALTAIKLDGDLAVPKTDAPDLRQSIDSVIFWASHYSDARDLTARLREAARPDNDLVRATVALAPFALVVGLALALAALLTRPLV